MSDRPAETTPSSVRARMPLADHRSEEAVTVRPSERQTVPGAKALIVTTPQDVALADVRKSINFCKAVNLQVLGLVENMGPFACPCCGKTIEVFKSGGGRRTAAEMGVSFLGSLPFEPQVVKASDEGKPLLGEAADTPFTRELNAVVDKIVELLQ